MGGAAPVQVSVLAAAAAESASASGGAVSSTGVPGSNNNNNTQISPRRSATAPDPPNVALHAVSATSTTSTSSMSSSASPASSSPVVQRSGSRLRQAFRWQKSDSYSPGPASPDARPRNSGGAWQRLAAWRKSKRDVAAPAPPSTASPDDSASAKKPPVAAAPPNPNSRATIWCVGDLVVTVHIDRKTSVDELRDALAQSARAADFELPPAFTLWVERNQSLVLLADLLGVPASLFDADTQLLVDGHEFRYLVLPSDFTLDDD